MSMVLLVVSVAVLAAAPQPMADHAVSAGSGATARQTCAVDGRLDARVDRRAGRGRGRHRPQRRRQVDPAARRSPGSSPPTASVAVDGESLDRPAAAGARAHVGLRLPGPAALPAPERPGQRRLRAAQPRACRAPGPRRPPAAGSTASASPTSPHGGRGQLSGGQAQRVAIARALATEPAAAAARRALRAGSTSASRPRCGSSWPATSRRTTGSRCWSPTTRSTRSPWPTGSWCSTSGRGRPGRHRPPRWPPSRAPTTSPGWSASTCCREGDVFRRSAPSAVTVSLAEPEGSARHRWHGHGRSALAPHGDAVRLLVGADRELLADVTPAAATELELVPAARCGCRSRRRPCAPTRARSG